MAHLTGNTRFRRGWFGKMVLQVEVDPCSIDGPFGNFWRDATLFDLQELGYKLETQVPPYRHPRPKTPPKAPPPPPTRQVRGDIRPKDAPPPPEMKWRDGGFTSESRPRKRKPKPPTSR